jgi:hypothetical protein
MSSVVACPTNGRGATSVAASRAKWTRAVRPVLDLGKCGVYQMRCRQSDPQSASRVKCNPTIPIVLPIVLKYTVTATLATTDAQPWQPRTYSTVHYLQLAQYFPLSFANPFFSFSSLLP